MGHRGRDDTGGGNRAAPCASGRSSVPAPACRFHRGSASRGARRRGCRPGRTDQRFRPGDAAFQCGGEGRDEGRLRCARRGPAAGRRRCRSHGVEAPGPSHGRERRGASSRRLRVLRAPSTTCTTRRCPPWRAGLRGMWRKPSARPRVPERLRPPGRPTTPRTKPINVAGCSSKSAANLRSARPRLFQSGHQAGPRIRGAVGRKGRRLHRPGRPGVRAAAAARVTPARERSRFSRRSS